jgi:hypothetical protein
MNLVLSGASPAALQWSLTYPAVNVTSIQARAGPAAAAAGKTLSCGTPGGITTCLVAGLNLNTIANGVVALVTVGLTAQATGDVPVGISGAVAATLDGSGAPVSATGGVYNSSSVSQQNTTRGSIRFAVNRGSDSWRPD